MDIDVQSTFYVVIIAFSDHPWVNGLHARLGVVDRGLMVCMLGLVW